MTRETFDPADVAAESVYRAWCNATIGVVGASDFAAFDELPLGIRNRWGGIAAESAAVMEEMDGKGYREVAARLYQLWNPEKGFAELSPAERVAWEAAGRHLHALWESDDPAELGRLEESWVDWARDRASKGVSGG